MAADNSINLDAVHAGLKATKLLRYSVRDLFKFLADGGPTSGGRNENDALNDPDGESHEANMLFDLRSAVEVITNRVRDLESACTLLAHHGTQVNLHLGNSGLVGLDPSWERTPLYSSMISAYRWSDRLLEHAVHAHAILSSNGLKRSSQPTGYINFNGRMRPAMSLPIFRRPNFSPVQVENFCHGLQRCFQDMHVEVIRPFGSQASVMVTLERVLRAIILFRGAYIEFVQVKGFHEDFAGDDGRLDIWSESRYFVFRKITNHANAAMLHFVHVTHPELAVKSFLVSFSMSKVQLFPSVLHLVHSNSCNCWWRERREKIETREREIRNCC